MTDAAKAVDRFEEKKNVVEGKRSILLGKE